jgi:hypothetical protein
MRKILLLAIIAVFSAPGFTQNSQCFLNPTIWLRADKPGVINNQWQDVSGNGYHATVQDNLALPDTALFNFNRCFNFDSSSHKLNIDFQAKESAKLIVFAVYKPGSSQPEKGIWNLALDSNIQVRLTTQRLKNVYMVIKYADSTSTIPIINLLNQNWQNKHVDSITKGLVIAGTDSLDFTGKFAEFMLYDTTLSGNDIYKVHTYLAIKYGVSIKDMNYVLSDDAILWNYEDNILYEKDIAAIGMDSVLQINQKQSAGNGGESPLKIAAGSLKNTNKENTTQIAEGDFLIWGNNGKSLSDINTDTLLVNQIDSMSKSVWLMKTAGTTYQNISTQVVLNASEIVGVTDVKLVINRYGDTEFPLSSSIVVTPDSVDSTTMNYYFDDIYWDTDNSGSDVFGFKIIAPQLITKNNIVSNDSVEDNTQNDSGSTTDNATNTNTDNTSGNTTNAIIDCSMFPNPTARDYTISLKVSSIQPLSVSIQDGNGKIIETFERQGSMEYTLQGLINETGCYFVTVRTGEESKTYKLLVQ